MSIQCNWRKNFIIYKEDILCENLTVVPVCIVPVCIVPVCGYILLIVKDNGMAKHECRKGNFRWAKAETF